MNPWLRTYDYRRESDDGGSEWRMERKRGHCDDGGCHYGDENEMMIRPPKKTPENAVSDFSFLAAEMKRKVVEKWGFLIWKVNSLFWLPMDKKNCILLSVVVLYDKVYIYFFINSVYKMLYYLH